MWLLQIIQLKHANYVPINFEREYFAESRASTLQMVRIIKRLVRSRKQVENDSALQWIHGSHSLSKMAAFRSWSDWKEWNKPTVSSIISQENELLQFWETTIRCQKWGFQYEKGELRKALSFAKTNFDHKIWACKFYRECEASYLHSKCIFIRRFNIHWQRNAVPPPKTSHKWKEHTA